MTNDIYIKLYNELATIIRKTGLTADAHILGTWNNNIPVYTIIDDEENKSNEFYMDVKQMSDLVKDLCIHKLTGEEMDIKSIISSIESLHRVININIDKMDKYKMSDELKKDYAEELKKAKAREAARSSKQWEAKSYSDYEKELGISEMDIEELKKLAGV